MHIIHFCIFFYYLFLRIKKAKKLMEIQAKEIACEKVYVCMQ